MRRDYRGRVCASDSVRNIFRARAISARYNRDINIHNRVQINHIRRARSGDYIRVYTRKTVANS